MSFKIISTLFTLSTLWLSACGVQTTATLPPSPKPLSVAYSPYLAGIQEALHACALELPQLAIFFEQIPGAQQELGTQDLVIWWGDMPSEAEYAYQLNNDELVPIVNPDNSKNELSRAELVSLFSGSIESWTEIGIHDQQVKVWIYPEENIISQVFQSGILGGQRITRLASLAPSPQAMLESIAGDPGAIGFIQRSWLSPEVKAIEIGSELKSSVQKPLLALSMSEPQGGIEALIACLQTGPGQESLSVYYGRAE